MKYSLKKTTELFLDCFQGCAETPEGELQLHVDKRFKQAFYTRTAQAELFAQEMLRISLDNMRAKLEAQENGTDTETSEGKEQETNPSMFPPAPKTKRRTKKRPTRT